MKQVITDTDTERQRLLERLMRDPRYWRYEDPTLAQKVREVFEAVYPNA